jgi:hypothetical protein
MKAAMKLLILIVVGVLVCEVPSASTHTGPPCTSAVSSVVMGQEPVISWYPPGCIHS